MPDYRITTKVEAHKKTRLEAKNKEEALKAAKYLKHDIFEDSKIVVVELLDDNGNTKDVYLVEDGKFKD